jgi:hypothetical protein
MKITIIKYLILSGKIAGAITSVVLMGYGFYSWSKKQGVDEATRNVKEVSYEGKIDKLILSDSLKTITLQELITKQNEMSEKQEEFKAWGNSLRGVVLDIAKNQKVTLDQMQQYMESTPVLKKKLMTQYTGQ